MVMEKLQKSWNFVESCIFLTFSMHFHVFSDLFQKISQMLHLSRESHEKLINGHAKVMENIFPNSIRNLSIILFCEC